MKFNADEAMRIREFMEADIFDIKQRMAQLTEECSHVFADGQSAIVGVTCAGCKKTI